MAALSAATIVAGVSAVTSATTATMSFIQAGEAKSKAAEASAAADKAIAEAKSKLDLNFYDAIGIQKEPYELQREALLAQGAEAVRAGQESERGAAATAGRIQMAQNEAQAGIRTQMGQDLLGLEKLSAAEDSRLRDVGAQISMEEAAGAQLARANFENMAGRATTQGVKSLVNLGKDLSGFVPLYMKQKGIDPNTGLKIVPPKPTPDATNKTAASAQTTQAATTTDNSNVVTTQANTPTGQTTTGVADMTPMATKAPAPVVTAQATNPASIDPTETPVEVGQYGSLTGRTEPSAEFISNMANLGFKWNPTTKQFER